MIGGKRRKIKTKTMSRKRRESKSTPTEPFEIAISAVTHELLKRGFGLKRDKVADFLRQLGDSFNGSDVSKMAQICLDKFLSLDLNSCGTGVLPPLTDHVDEITLDGPFILQVGGIVELGYQLTDGVQTVDGLVVEPVEGLRVHPGLKVKISNVPVTTGKLMLLPENTEVLGGGLEGCISGLVVCFGETLIDILPTMGGVSLAEVPAFKIAPCGAANVAVGISKLGGSSAVISKVGEDEFGRMLANILKLNNVNTSGMLFDSKARTTLAFVTLSADGERKFLFSENPSADMPPDEPESELDLNLIKKAKVFHYGSFSLIDESCKLAHLAALRIAKDSGCILSYDPNLRLGLWPSDKAAREGIMSIWDQADVIKISDDEIAFLTDGGDPYDDDAVLNKLFRPNLKLLIVTEGSDGCRYYTKDFKGIVRGINVKPVDTTGAADAFVSGILYNIASDPSIFEDEERLKNALHFSNVCGAIQATSLHYPTKDDVLQFNAI